MSLEYASVDSFLPYHHGVVAPVLLRASRKEESARKVREMEVI